MKVFKKLAFAGLFSGPLKYLRWTGWLKYRPVPYGWFDPITYEQPEPFHAPHPQTVTDQHGWNVSMATEAVMAHSLEVREGIADCFGDVFDRKGRLIEGATHKNRGSRKYCPWRKRRHLLRKKRLFPDMVHVDASVAVLTASTQDFYFHWICDVLPRLFILAQHPGAVDFYYIQIRHKYQRETLELLGLDKSKIISADEIPVLTANKLVVPCHQVMNGRVFPRWTLEYLKRSFTRHSAEKKMELPKRFFISRGEAGHRRLENESEICERLEEYGVVKVDLAKLPFTYQVALFQNAELIIAPHGSGLTNLVFCNPGTKVVELFPAANVDLYYRLSMALDLNYTYIKAKIGDPSKFSLANYSICWDDLAETLSACLSVEGQEEILSA